jgi:hypothetical protein
MDVRGALHVLARRLSGVVPLARLLRAWHEAWLSGQM